MKFIKLIILLLILILPSCGGGCISAESFGSLKLKNITVFADPVTSNGVRAGLIRDTDSSNKNCEFNQYWTPLYEEYNVNNKYVIRSTGNVSFCNFQNKEIISENIIFDLKINIANDYQENKKVRSQQYS